MDDLHLKNVSVLVNIDLSNERESSESIESVDLTAKRCRSVLFTSSFYRFLFDGQGIDVVPVTGRWFRSLLTRKSNDRETGFGGHFCN